MAQQETPKEDKSKDNSFALNFRYIWLFVLIYLVMQSFWNYQSTTQINYSEFKNLLKQEKIKEVTLQGENITGELKEPREGNTKFQTTRVDDEIAGLLEEHGVEYSKVADSGMWGTMIAIMLPFVLIWGLFYYFARRAMGKGMGGLGQGLMSVGKSRAKIYVETDTKTTFKDVAGADEALEELQEVIDFLKNSEKIRQLGGKMPKGILLVGPPGTGKTLIAKAVAGEAGVPFFSTNGAEFVEMFVGVGAARVRDLFEQAKKSAPCIIFIDELDALGKVRHSSPMSGNDEKEQTLNQLLVEMDGFNTNSGVIILGATNRPEIIDPALMRAGRFDRQVVIDKPDKKGRIDILELHTKDVKLGPEVSMEKIAALTAGFSGADLANLVNEAALIATREDADMINMDHLTNALERIMAGLQKKSRILNEFERRVVAFHEMGHALVNHGFNKDDRVHKVSIIPRAIGSMGYSIQRPTEERFIMTKEQLENKMAVLMGGRAAEALIFSHLSTGASDDIMKATNIAREMITKYGMSEELGFVSYDERNQTFLKVEGLTGERNYSEKTAEQMDVLVKDMVMNAFNKAYHFLEDHQDLLEYSAGELLRLETLSEDELEPIFARIPEARPLYPGTPSHPLEQQSH